MSSRQTLIKHPVHVRYCTTGQNIRGDMTQRLPLDLMIQEETDKRQATVYCAKCSSREPEVSGKASWKMQPLSCTKPGKIPRRMSKRATQEGRPMTHSWPSGRQGTGWALRQAQLSREEGGSEGISEAGRTVSGHCHSPSTGTRKNRTLRTGMRRETAMTDTKHLIKMRVHSFTQWTNSTKCRKVCVNTSVPLPSVLEIEKTQHKETAHLFVLDTAQWELNKKIWEWIRKRMYL